MVGASQQRGDLATVARSDRPADARADAQSVSVPSNRTFERAAQILGERARIFLAPDSAKDRREFIAAETRDTIAGAKPS